MLVFLTELESDGSVIGPILINFANVTTVFEKGKRTYINFLGTGDDVYVQETLVEISHAIAISRVR